MNRILLSSALTGTACYIALEVAAPTLTSVFGGVGMTAQRAHLCATAIIIAGRSVLYRALAFTGAVALGTLTYAFAWTP